MKQTRSKVRPMVAAKLETDVIIKVVCSYFNVSFDDLKLVTRRRPVVYKRQVAMYFLVHYTNETFVDIGLLFEKDHTTVMYSKDLIRNLADIDSKVKNDIEIIKKLIIEAYF